MAILMGLKGILHFLNGRKYVKSPKILHRATLMRSSISLSLDVKVRGAQRTMCLCDFHQVPRCYFALKSDIIGSIDDG